MAVILDAFVQLVQLVLVLLLARIIGQETLTPVKVAGVILSFCGIALLAIGQGLSLHAGRLAGDLIAIGGAVLYPPAMVALAIPRTRKWVKSTFTGPHLENAGAMRNSA